MEIKSKEGKILFASPTALSVGEAVEEAVRNGVCLAEANLRLADLSGRELSNGSFIGADLSGSNLSGARLSDARLDYANLAGADLANADLTCSVCYGARLDRANLSKADLTGAVLTAATLSGAQLNGAKLKGACLEKAIGDGERIITVRMDKVHLVATRHRIWLNSAELHTEEFINDLSLERFSSEIASFLSSYHELIAKILKKKFDLG